MSPGQLYLLACRVRQLAGVLVEKDTSDADLLERFTAAGGLRPPSPPWWSGMRGWFGPSALALPRPEDAEDAFQATFLDFLRKAGSVRLLTATVCLSALLLAGGAAWLVYQGGEPISLTAATLVDALNRRIPRRPGGNPRLARPSTATATRCQPVS